MTYTREDFTRETRQLVISHLTPEERWSFLAKLPTEERLLGLKPEERLLGLKPEERLSGLKPEERLSGLKPEERLSGLKPEERLSAEELQKLKEILQKLN